MRKKTISFLSLFLVICMVMSSIPVYAITGPEVRLDTPVTNVENGETSRVRDASAANSSKVLDYVDNAARNALLLKRAFFQRVPDELEAINNTAGNIIFDFDDYTIKVQNRNSLTSYEKRAILTCFTADVTFNSFAAEVEYHADMARDYPNIGYIQKSAIRADMAIKIDYNPAEPTPYYDLNSDYVQAQIQAHGEY